MEMITPVQRHNSILNLTICIILKGWGMAPESMAYHRYKVTLSSYTLVLTMQLLYSIDVKKFFTFFIIFIKNSFFNVFYFWNVFYFLVEKFFYPTKPAKILLNLLNFFIKRLLSDGFNMAAIKILS